MKETMYEYHLFVFYKDGTYKIKHFNYPFHLKNTKKYIYYKFLRYLPYDKSIKKFFVIKGNDISHRFKLKLDRELNNKFGYYVYVDEKGELIETKIK